jgi:hypothetical protein
VILTHKERVERKTVVVLATDSNGLKLQIAIHFPEYDWFAPVDEVYDVV